MSSAGQLGVSDATRHRCTVMQATRHACAPTPAQLLVDPRGCEASRQVSYHPVDPGLQIELGQLRRITALLKQAPESGHDRGPRGASRPRHHLPVGRGCGDWPDGASASASANASRPRRDPPIADTAVMRVTLELPANERARPGRSVWCAEKRRRWAGVMRVCNQIGLHSGVLAQPSAARAAKHLIKQQIQATLPSSGSPVGECRFGSLRPKPVH